MKQQLKPVLSLLACAALKNTDGTITVEKALNSDGRYVLPAMPNLVQNIPGIFPYSQAGINYSQDGVMGKTVTGEGNYPEAFEQLALEDKIRPVIDVWDGGVWGSGAYLLGIHDKVTALYKACIKAAITDHSEDISQLIREYKDQMQEIGGESLLNSMNSQLHTHAVYFYY